MNATLGFDVYGTLIDTAGVVRQLNTHIGDTAEAFSALWRRKQLEYSFRRGLMKDYQPFPVCTRDALEYACRHFRVALSDSVKDDLLALYRRLPPFPDVPAGLEQLAGLGLPLYAFSNGAPEDIASLLEHAGIAPLFSGIVSVDPVRSFKPDPAVYRHFMTATGSDEQTAWLVSSNPFDVIGAVTAGMKAAWLKRRHHAVFDTWGPPPTAEVDSLDGLVSLFRKS